MLRLLVRTYFVERKKLICLLKFKVGIESEFDKNELNKNFKAKFYFWIIAMMSTLSKKSVARKTFETGRQISL